MRPRSGALPADRVVYPKRFHEDMLIACTSTPTAVGDPVGGRLKGALPADGVRLAPKEFVRFCSLSNHYNSSDTPSILSDPSTLSTVIPSLRGIYLL